MASNEGGEGVSNTESSNAKQIWQTLSKLNVNDHTEKKGHLTYLSWAWAYQTMMDHFPDMQIIWSTFRDVDGMDRDVLYYPDRAISDTKMRCLVKCFALFGLGLYIFAGSDLPEEEEFVAPNRVKTPEEHQAFLEAIEKHVAKFKAKVELNGFFRKLEPWFSDLREITDADGVTGYDDLVKKFKMYATKVK